MGIILAPTLGLQGGLVHMGQGLAHVEPLAGTSYSPLLWQGWWCGGSAGVGSPSPLPASPPTSSNEPKARPHSTILLFSHLQRFSHIPELTQLPLSRMSFLTSAQAEQYLLSEAASYMLSSLIPPPEVTWLPPCDVLFIHLSSL